jgi:hypothetical protein
VTQKRVPMSIFASKVVQMTSDERGWRPSAGAAACRLLLVGAALVLASCGGGGGSGAAAGPEDTHLKSGIYHGQVVYKAAGIPDRSVAAFLVLLADGEARYRATDCVMMAGSLGRSQSSAAGGLLALAPNGCAETDVGSLYPGGKFPDGSAHGEVAFELSYSNGKLTGSVNGAGMAGSLDMSFESALSGLGSSLSPLVGTYEVPGWLLEPQGVAIDAAGEVSGSISAFGARGGPWRDGRLTLLDPALNVYRVTFADDLNGVSGHAIRLPDGTLVVSVNSPGPPEEPLPYGLTFPLTRQP